MAATIDDLQFRRARNLPSKPNATAAHDATVGKQRHMRAEVMVLAGERLDVGLSFLVPKVEVVVLQPALTGLIADGAVDGMIEQQAFLNELLIRHYLRTVRNDDRAVLHGRLTPWDKL